MNNQDHNPFHDIQLSPQDTLDLYKEKENDPNSKKNPFNELQFDEGFWKNAYRTALQIPQGVAEATNYGIGTGLFQMLALGGSELDVDEWHKLRELSEENGIPFDEEAYEKARGEMLGMIPTVSNIGREVEEKTGIPLEPKTWYQKLLRLGSMAGKFQPGTLGEKATAGATAAATSGTLQAAGVPEGLAEIPALVAGGVAGSKGPKIDIGKAKKPSGLTERRYEGLTKEREVSPKKLDQINRKVKQDFKQVTDEIIENAPVGETINQIKENPALKAETSELFDEVQQVADSMLESVSGKSHKKKIIDTASKKKKGYAESEYEKEYNGYMRQAADRIKDKEILAGKMVEQYRKNNKSLSEYFEPGSSKSKNRAKKDALLDENKAIADSLKDQYKDSPFVKIFEESNDRWSKIMDAEAVDSFIGKIFEDGINFKKMDKFLNQEGYQFTFRRALGDKGYDSFKNVIKDVLKGEEGYKMLKIAKEKGYSDLVTTAISYVISPKLGAAHTALSFGKMSLKHLMNSILDKPKLVFEWEKGLSQLKGGDFNEAEKTFKKLDSQVTTQ